MPTSRNRHGNPSHNSRTSQQPIFDRHKKTNDEEEELVTKDELDSILDERFEKFFDEEFDDADDEDEIDVNESKADVRKELEKKISYPLDFSTVSLFFPLSTFIVTRSLALKGKALSLATSTGT